MDTGKQINAMVVVVLLVIIAVGFYALFDPFRADSAKDDQLDMSAKRAAHTFALNCRLCHGDRGQGGVNGGRLPAAPMLDRPDLQGFDSSGFFDTATFNENYKLIVDTITCGRAGTFMPTWGRANGGTLSDEQIRQLAVLITGGNLGANPIHQGGFWDLAQEEADTIDAEATDDAMLEMAGGSLSADETALTVSDASKLTPAQVIRIDDERLQILPKMIEVVRGVGGTAAAAHTSGTEIFLGSVDTGKTITADLDTEATQIVIDDTRTFSVGDTIRVDDEQMRVTDVITGVPTTNQQIIDDIGREPKEAFVSGANGIAVGDIIRAGAELLQVTGIRSDGSLDIALDSDVTASSDTISVDNPNFFSPYYTFHVDNETMQVVGAVQTGQLLANAIGRAQTTITATGSVGLDVGELIRMNTELLEIESIEPATVTVERGANDVDENATTPAAHNAGVAVLKQVAPPAEGQPAENPDTGQTLLEAVGPDDTTLIVSGTTGISTGSTIQLGNESLIVDETTPAVLHVRRGVGGTSRGEHARRVPIFQGNLIQVQRGVLGTTAAAHSSGTELLFDVLAFDREVNGSKLEDHAKNTELFIGDNIVVERGYLSTDPAEHMNGAIVRNFPLAPDGPATTGTTCGQHPPVQATAEPADQDRPDAPNIDVSLSEYQINLSEQSATAGKLDWPVKNDGTIVHNFRVIKTDLAPDALPLDGDHVDETQVDVVGGFTSPLQPGDTLLKNVDLLEPGNYVIICNIPTHYQQGMHTAFTVNP